MSETLYTVQTLVIGAVLLLLLRKSSIFLQIQVVAWMIGVLVLAHRFGVSEQLNFYSNDQRFYVSVVTDLRFLNLSPDLDWWISYSKIPYTLPAGVLTGLGIDSGLALKAISLVCLLLLTRLVLAAMPDITPRRALPKLFITACGGIGMLYSILALRETMMMLFATYYLVSRNITTRLMALLLLLLLRPHLAAALLVATILVWLWELIRIRRESTASSSILIVIAICLGELLYSIGVSLGSVSGSTFGNSWGLRTGWRVISNFVGLQFMTSYSESLELSLKSLLLLRILFSETILIPLLFTAVVLIRSQHLDTTARLTVVAFSLYVSLVSNTEFNSFRQNIPFMTTMGLVILTAWSSTTQQKSVVMHPSSVSKR